MKRLARAAVLSTVADRLREHESWAGETHIQKAAFFLQVGLGVPLGYNFILYKHGPFAFDLREDLGGFAADRLIAVRPQSPPYGPRLETTENGRALQARFPKTLAAHAPAVETVAAFLGSRGVGDLERLGTALLLLREDTHGDDDRLASEMTRLKPHVSHGTARDAVCEVRAFLAAQTP